MPGILIYISQALKCMENTLITGEVSFWIITELEMIHGGCISTGELSYAGWILQLGMTILSTV